MKLLDKIKHFFKKNKELKEYHYGDIIWCYIDKYGDFIFEGNHQIRPFIFLYYKNKTIYGYTMTHKVPSKYKLHYELDIMTDNQYVILSCLFELPKKSYKGYKDKLSKENASLIGKIIYNMHDDKLIKEDIRNSIIIKDNDIVIYNNKTYLVYSVNLDNLTLYEITKNKNDIRIELSKREYVYISINPIIVKKDDVIYCDTFKKYICYIFNKLKKERTKNIVKTNSLQTNLLNVGDIIKTNKGVLVILDTTKTKYVVCKYYADYPQTFCIDKKCKYKVIKHISIGQILQIKNTIEKVKSKISTFSN